MTNPLELWNALHLIGLCLAFGGVFVADFSGFALLVRKGSKQLIFPTVELLHVSIFLGLFLLILSGGFILYERFATLAEVPVKVWCKLILVALLIVNGIYLQRKVIPVIRKLVETNKQRPLINYIPRDIRLKFAANTF